MKLVPALLTTVLSASTAFADSIVAARNIRPYEVLTADMLLAVPDSVDGAAIHADQLLGMEASVALFSGRTIMLSQVAPPAVVERNAIVPLIFTKGALSIEVEGRALGRGSVGERIRAMNLQSKTSLTAIVQPNGTLLVTE